MGKPGKLGSIKPEEFRKLYQDEKLSEWEIARRLGVTQGAIHLRLVQYGIPRRNHDDSIRLNRLRHNFTGKNNPNWNGGIYISPWGYRMLRNPKHHRAQKRGYVFEHIIVWEKAHNQNLPEGWVIHHLNGVKTDNHPENLVALSSKEHLHYIPKLQERIRELESKLKRRK